MHEQTTATPATSVLVDVSEFFDNRGITAADELAGGAFNIWSNTFAADELPAPGGLVESGGVRFRFPAPRADGMDNLRCAAQLIAVPEGRYDWIHLIAAAERRSEDVVHLHYGDGSADPEWLRVSDFWPETAARFGERIAARGTRLHYPRHIQHGMGPAIWHTRVPVPRHCELAAIHLPDNPAIHVFALSLMEAR